ncbi:hypothetical protein I3A86_24710, partial [Salmonella enterica]|nr:hypothetical protein [Salmonella enterica]
MEEIQEKSNLFSRPNLFLTNTTGKHVNSNGVDLKQVFPSEAHLFLPSTRFENPHWLNSDSVQIEPDIGFNPIFSDRLDNPIVLQTSMRKLKPWIVDVLFDAGHPDFTNSINDLNNVLRTALGDMDVFVARTNRMLAERRLCIAKGQDVQIPTLDHLSSGQAALVSLFWNIMRFGDRGIPAKPAAEIKGIVIVDEIDTHLHSDLQFS